MGRPVLTADFVRSILRYDPETGIFTWRTRKDRKANWNSTFAGKEAGTRVSDYVYITINLPFRYPAHHLAWVYIYGAWPPKEVDHRNRIRHDNRLSNLRLATRAQNGRNLPRMKNNTTGAAGISFNQKRQKFQAAIKKDSKQVWFRRFDTLEEAVAARKKALVEIHGEFASEG